MHLYIMRHGIAFEPHEWTGDDASRPLTEKGNQRTREILKTLRDEKKLRADAIFSSPLVRAKETAAIAADVLELKVRIVDALACGASLGQLKKSFSDLKSLPERLMLVGHAPDCGALVGELIGDPVGDYAFKKAGIACLTGEFAANGMKLKWHLSPKDVLNED